MSQVRTELESIVVATKLSETAIKSRRANVRKEILNCSSNVTAGDFERIGSNDLKTLMDYYDELFFDGLCRQVIKDNQDFLSFRVSTRMTSTGGKTTIEPKAKPISKKHFVRRNFEIAISATLLFGSFNQNSSRDNNRLAVHVAGVRCQDRLDAMQRIFEHELLHLIEFLIWNCSSCAAKRFRSIAWRIFGHEQSNHQLITPSEKAELQQGISVGDFVAFRHSGHQLHGYVNHINRRATVLVPDGQGAKYTDGKRYAKYYVPISKLSRSV